MNEVLARGAGIPPRKPASRDLRLVYCDALEAYLAEGTRKRPRGACDLGRRAIAQRISIVKIATLHHGSLGRILARLSGAASCKEGLRRAAEFLAEALSPYAVAHRQSPLAVP